MGLRNLSGQSAIEYLMTYGWMLLVVAVAGGAIYSIVGDQTIQSASGFSGSDFAVQNFGLSEDSLDFVLRNSAAEEITVNSVKVTDPETGLSNQVDLEQEISVSETSTVEVPGVEQGDSSKSLDVEVNYDAGGLSNLSVSGTVSGALEVVNKLSLEDASFNRSTNELSIDVKNKGQDSTESISYTVESNSTDYTGDLNNLDSGETTSISISTDQTYPLESVNLDVEGPKFTNSNSNLKCTPTKGLVGYWPFNKEQTQNGWAADLSGYGNNGSLENGLAAGKEGFVGEAYDYDGSDDYLKISHSYSLSLQDGFTVNTYAKRHSGTETNQIFSKRDNQNIEFQDEGSAIKYYYNDGGGQFNQITSINSNEWNMVSLTGANETGAKLSINARLMKQKDITNYNYTGDQMITIGSDRNPPKEPYDGKIDELRIYNRSLSQEELTRLYEVRNKNWAVSGCKLAK